MSKPRVKTTQSSGSMKTRSAHCNVKWTAETPESTPSKNNSSTLNSPSFAFIYVVLFSTKEGINAYYYEDHNNTLNRVTNTNNTLVSVLEGIQLTLCELDVSRPGSVASSCHIDDDRRSYESDYQSIGGPMGSVRLSGRYSSSTYGDSTFLRYPTPLQY